MAIKEGSIVTVTLKSQYQGLQGRVLGIFNDGDSDGPIEVQFGEEYADWFFHHNIEEARRIRYVQSDLKEEADWSLKNKAMRLFPNYFHCTAFRNSPFQLGAPCEIQGCSATTAQRILFNCNGVVYDMDVCEGCAKTYHGKCGEILPLKQKR